MSTCYFAYNMKQRPVIVLTGGPGGGNADQEGRGDGVGERRQEPAAALPHTEEAAAQITR